MTKNPNLTIRGVAKDLSLSPYTFTYCHDGTTIILNFSSKLHLNNFLKERNKNYFMLYNYIYKRFKFKTDPRLLSDLNLYGKIENRGCYVKINDEVHTELKTISLK